MGRNYKALSNLPFENSLRKFVGKRCKLMLEQEIRDQIAAEYFESLPFQPYPVQEEALLAWFTAEQGVLVCAPTGTVRHLSPKQPYLER